MVHAQQVQGTHAAMLFSGGAGLVPLNLRHHPGAQFQPDCRSCGAGRAVSGVRYLCHLAGVNHRSFVPGALLGRRAVVRIVVLDLIPAHTSLFSAEFHLPAMTARNRRFSFWDLLRTGLAPLRAHYDYIMMDTAPSLSYLTINALMAADALIVPLVPESLDFMSSVAFWSLFVDMSGTFLNRGGGQDLRFHLRSALAGGLRTGIVLGRGALLGTARLPGLDAYDRDPHELGGQQLRTGAGHGV